MNSIRKELSGYRLEKAHSALAVARILAGQGYWADSANRSYYSIFHAVRAVLAMDAFDSSKHSGVISYFLERYIKTGLMDIALSDYVRSAFLIRNKSDYDDFYIVRKEDAEKQIEDAATFIAAVEKHLLQRWEQICE